ncbi:NineTeen Complex (NTC) component, partial [Elasticomyces elasticus]
EMFEAAKPRKEEKEKGLGEQRAELGRRVDAGYYGYNLDEEDGTLLAYEARKEREAFQAMLEAGDDDVDMEWEPLPGDTTGDGAGLGGVREVEGWKLSTAEEVEAELLERRRRRLLDAL